MYTFTQTGYGGTYTHIESKNKFVILKTAKM